MASVVAPAPRFRRRATIVALALSSCLALTGCDTVSDWFGEGDNGPKLAGNRISVLQLTQVLEPDPALGQAPVTLPQAVANPDWSMPGGTPTHSMGNPAFSGQMDDVWSRSIAGGSEITPLISGPVIAGGRLFVLDTDFDLHAFDAKTGARLWDRNILRPDQEGESFGGGVSVGPDGRLYATTGFGDVVVMNAADGSDVWRRRIAAPLRQAPTVAESRVFVMTADNQLIVFAMENGVLQWTHGGAPEDQALLGGSVAAVENDVVVVPYSSGEVLALRVANGQPAWSDNISIQRAVTSGTLGDVKGLPVIDRGLVFAVSYSGRMVAINLRTGQRVWEQDVGGLNTPAVVGDWIFVITNDAQLVALARDSGRVRWISQLQRYEDEEDRDGPLQWAGPVVANGRLFLTNSNEELVEVSPEDGKVLAKHDLPGPTIIPPVVADGLLYVLTDDGDLVAYR